MKDKLLLWVSKGLLIWTIMLLSFELVLLVNNIIEFGIN